MKYIERSYYTDKIKLFIDKRLIKVITGQRRVGKSYLLYQVMDFIKSVNPPANIIYINRELEEFAWLKSDTELMDYLKSKLNPTQSNYLFIDEVQEIESFQKVLRSLLAKNQCDIYCTGSNARILSGDLATYLAGRYIEVNIHSLSFKEFLLFHQLECNLDSLMKYLTYGGMPYLSNIGLEENIPFEYLRNVYSTILLKDVVARAGIRNVTFLENLVAYLADNVGSLFSAANISRFLKSQHIALTPQLTLNYLKALTNAYFIHKVPRAAVGGLKIFEIGEKYYFEDLGLRNTIRGINIKADISKLMENAVLLHLIVNGYRVYVGKTNNHEIDFMAVKDKQKIYVQVCRQLTDQETAEREFGNLLEIKDNFPKYVVTFNDPMIGNVYRGIIQYNLLDFLLMDL
jgi:predicted AAA+ superfamily ATPase